MKTPWSVALLLCLMLTAHAAEKRIPLIQARPEPIPVILGGLPGANLENKRNQELLYAYQVALVQQVKAHWIPPAGYSGFQPVVLVIIGRHGELLGQRILRASGNANLDQQALDTVAKSGPYAPLPVALSDSEAHFTVHLGTTTYHDLEQSPDVLKAYLMSLDKQVRSHWNPPYDRRTKQVVAFLTISKTGELLNAGVKRPSGFADADSAALAAIRQAAPFSPLPEAYTQELADVEFVFGYRAVLNEGTRFKTVNPFRY
jgi:TonB family protein